MTAAEPGLCSRYRRFRAVGGVLAVLAFAAQPTRAADWQLLYTLGETVQYSDNIQQEVNPKGSAGSSQTSASFDLKALGRSWQWALAGNFGYLAYFGEGAPSPRTSTNAGGTSTISKSTRDTDYSLSAHVSEAPAQSTQQTDLGIVTSNIMQLSYGAMGQVVHRADRLDTIDMNVSFDRSDYSKISPDVTPSDSLKGATTWTRRLTPLIDGRLQTSVLFYRLDGSPQTDQLVYNIVLGSKAQLTRRLSVDASIGPTIIQQVNPGSSTSVEVTGGLILSYQPRHDLKFALSASQDVAPDNVGGLQTFQSASASVNYQINDYTNLNLTTAFSNSTSTATGGTASKYFTVSPSLTYVLARNWNAVLSYRWVRSDAGTGIAYSNSVFLTISYNGVLVH